MKRRSVPAPRAGALDAVLAEALGVPVGKARALVAAGAVYVRGRRCVEPGKAVEQGAPLTAVLEASGASATLALAPRAPLEVLFEDARLLVVNKPAGLAAQPTPARRGDDLWSLASRHLGREAGLVHRLDKDTTGLTVFGKTRAATGALAAEFREGRARKCYLAAVVRGLGERGAIDLPLSKDPSRPGRWRATRRANGLAAHTDYLRLGESDGWALVALFPRTGRTHQLRAHLAASAAPILGDALYGGPAVPAVPALPDAPAPARCLLHAYRLELLGLRFVAPPPEDLARYLAAADVDLARVP